MADMVLFGPSRADASVTTEGGHRLAARQCTGAGGRLVVTYPDPAPWASCVVAPGEAPMHGGRQSVFSNPTSPRCSGLPGFDRPAANLVSYPRGSGSQASSRRRSTMPPGRRFSTAGKT